MKRIWMLIAASLALVALAAPAAAQDEKTDEKPTSRPLTKGELKNEICPVTGEPTMARHFIAYTDEENKVFARIYFASAEAVEKAKKDGDLKALYTKVFLTAKNGKLTPYGKTVADVQNAVCPFTGEETEGSEEMINYNGFKVRMCCPGCAEGTVKEPDKFLHNVNDAIDRTLAELKKKGLK